MTAAGLIHAMIAEYVIRTGQAGNTIYAAGMGDMIYKAGMGDMITHAVMVAYGEDLETATERAGDMITDVMLGMD